MGYEVCNIYRHVSSNKVTGTSGGTARQDAMCVQIVRSWNICREAAVNLLECTKAKVNSLLLAT